MRLRCGGRNACYAYHYHYRRHNYGGGEYCLYRSNNDHYNHNVHNPNHDHRDGPAYHDTDHGETHHYDQADHYRDHCACGAVLSRVVRPG